MVKQVPVTHCLSCGTPIFNGHDRIPGHTYKDDFCFVCKGPCDATKNPACGKCGGKVYPKQ